MKGKEILAELQHLIQDPTYRRYNEINRAYRKICRITHFNWLRETSDSLLTFRADVVSYQLDTSTMRRLDRVWVKEGSNQQRYILMQEAPPQLFEDKVAENRKNDGTDDTARPKWYKIEGGPVATLTVSPTPDQDYSTRLDFTAHDRQLGAEDIFRLGDAYLDTVAMLAASMILERSKDPDLRQLAERYRAEATGDGEKIVRDSHPNRTTDIDRTAQDWIR